MVLVEPSSGILCYVMYDDWGDGATYSERVRALEGASASLLSAAERADAADAEAS